ncbi:MAG: hypothetical protein ACLKAK_01400 [Alkaliphilus sp.]
MSAKITTMVVVAIIFISINSYSYATEDSVLQGSEENIIIENSRQLDEVQETLIEAPSDFGYSEIDEQSESNSLFTIVEPIFPVVINTENLVLQITAPIGTNLRIEQYANISLIVEEEKYVKVQNSIQVEIGLLERAWYEIRLRRGNNKIVISAICEDGKTHRETRVVYVKKVEDLKELLEMNKTDDDSFRLSSEMINNEQ